MHLALELLIVAVVWSAVGYGVWRFLSDEEKRDLGRAIADRAPGVLVFAAVVLVWLGLILTLIAAALKDLFG